MAESIPSSVSTFMVVGRLVNGVGDSSDVGQDPDIQSIPGVTVTFTPSIESPVFSVPSALPDPVTIYQMPIVATTDSSGYLIIPGETARGVELMYGFDPHLIPNGWTWDVEIDVGGNFPAQTFSITGTDGGIVDLSSVIPVPSNPGADIPEWISVIDEMTALRDELYEVMGGLKATKMTNAAYTALPVKDPNTVYYIVG